MGFFSKLAFKKLKKSAEGGNQYDQYKLAECYYHGKDVEQDYAQAFRWYVEAARRVLKIIDNSIYDYAVLDAMYMVAVCYQEGKGVQRNPEFADRILSYIYQCCFESSGEPKEDLIDRYMHDPSEETLQKVKQAYAEIERKELAAHAQRCPAYAAYLRAWKEKYITQEILEHLEHAAADGNIECLRALGMLYLYDIDWLRSVLQADATRSQAYFEKAASLGDTSTYLDLADRLISDASYYKDYPKDPQKARVYLDKAVATGDKKAINTLAFAYLTGKPIVNGRTDYHKVIALLLPQISRPCPLGEFSTEKKSLETLASAYCHLDQYTEAIRYYEMALDLPAGDPFAEFDSNICEYIGNIYAEGLHDKSKAREWYWKGIIFDGNVNCRAAMERIGG